jgi:Tfp pilus assembly protein PilN
LPTDLRVKESASASSAVYILYLIPVFIAILLLLNIYFGISAVISGGKLLVMKNQWNQMQPQKTALDNFKKQDTMLTPDAKELLGFLRKRINWSEKLNSLVSDLPYGIWFRELGANNNELNIQGSAISLQKEELAVINTYISNLKNDQGFFKDFSVIELKSVLTKNVGTFDVVEFVLTVMTNKK